MDTSADTSRSCSPLLEADQETEDGQVKRKHKSLLALCKKFLEMYPLELPPESSLDIPLELLSETLNLSRRRLYDIINIMESLQMAVKVTKNLYRWYGNRKVRALLIQLKDLSDRELCIDMVQLMCPPLSEVTESPGAPMQPPCTPQGELSAQTLLFRSMGIGQISLPPTSTKKRPCSLNNMKESPEPKRLDSWKMKSLGGTCLKFLALFFKHQTVSLDWAGRVLLCGEDEDKPSSQSSIEEEENTSKEQDRLLRNKVRRIYDVANVLCALGLVCKISPRDSTSRKLLYAYSGPAIGTLVPPCMPATANNVLLEPAKPSRKLKKPDEKEKVDLDVRSSSEGLCKRRLDLGTVDVSSRCKRILQDDALLEDASSALDVLLAVAQRELQDCLGNKPAVQLDTAQTQQDCLASKPATQSSVQHELQDCVGNPTIQPSMNSRKSVKQLVFNIQPQSAVAVCNQTSNQVLTPNTHTKSQANENKSNSNQENKYTPMSKLILPKEPNQTSISENRSALRSLLENNRNTPLTNYDFPVIKKFVVLHEEKMQKRSVLVATPVPQPTQVQTVVIRNMVSSGSQTVRRGALSIPWQLNHRATDVSPFVTHLKIGLSSSTSSHQ